jgi:CDP-glycerol glycerophosphotransferase (TagB/SpsB family)
MKQKHQFVFDIAVCILLIGLYHTFYLFAEYSLEIGFISVIVCCYFYRKEILTTRLKFRIRKNLFNFLQHFTKKNAYVLIDDLFEENAECIDAYSLFLWMQEHNVPSYYVVWKKNYFYEKLKKENKLKNIIVVDKKFGTDLIKKGFIPLLKTKIIVSAFLNWGNFSEERKRIQKWISKNKSITHVYLDHGVVFFKKDVLNAYTPTFFNKLIVSNDIEKEIYKSKGGWIDTDILQGGLTRWDFLKKQVHSQKNIFIFFTFRKTFYGSKNYQDFDYYKNIISLFNNKRLRALLKRYNVKLIYGVHHAIYDQTNLDWKIEADNIEIADIQNISQYIKNTDLFITDYSSIVFDFMFLNIPTIFYKIDFLDQKLCSIDKLSINKFNECEPYIYNIVVSEDELIDRIEFYIKNGFKLEEENISKNNKFFYFRENIAQKVYLELEKL